jgi:hypothetical protein
MKKMVLSVLVSASMTGCNGNAQPTNVSVELTEPGTISSDWTEMGFWLNDKSSSQIGSTSMTSTLVEVTTVTFAIDGDQANGFALLSDDSLDFTTGDQRLIEVEYTPPETFDQIDPDGYARFHAILRWEAVDAGIEGEIALDANVYVPTEAGNPYVPCLTITRADSSPVGGQAPNSRMEVAVFTFSVDAATCPEGVDLVMMPLILQTTDFAASGWNNCGRSVYDQDGNLVSFEPLLDNPDAWFMDWVDGSDPRGFDSDTGWWFGSAWGSCGDEDGVPDQIPLTTGYQTFPFYGRPHLEAGQSRDLSVRLDTHEAVDGDYIELDSGWVSYIDTATNVGWSTYEAPYGNVISIER